MNRDLQKAFDKELKKDLNRSRRTWFLIAGSIIFVLAVFTPIFSSSVYGETVEVAVKDRSDVARTSIKVKLDSDEVVVIFVDNKYEHFIGQKVEVSKMSSAVGMASYQFTRYVN